MTPRLCTISLAALGLLASLASAHPVPKDTHDRTIVVRLQKTDTPNRVRVRVEYRLEVDEGTVVDSDMEPYKDVVKRFEYRGEGMKYYAKFTEIYAPIYAANLLLYVNKKHVEEGLHPISRKERLVDEDGRGIHLRCDFVFEKTFDLDSQAKTYFSLYEKNYWLQEGKIVLSLVNETDYAVESRTAPDDAFRKRAQEMPEPGDEDRLREVAIVFLPNATGTPDSEPAKAQIEPRDSHNDWFNLRRLILDTQYGFWLIMLLAFLFGAAHALTPGHGKTLVAAYLVGERGTIWHAVFLGVVTTLTHTGAVMILAVILALLPPEMRRVFQVWIQNGLGLVMGLIVTCMGFWLLLQRLSGRADHIHLDGGHHHHHAPEGAPSARKLNWWGLVVLGVTGGIIPCWDAVGVLVISVSTNEVWLVLPAVLVFSAGLAAVLVLIGILVVQVPRFVESRFGSGRLLHALPIVSAILVTLMGLWLCYEGTRGM